MSFGKGIYAEAGLVLLTNLQVCDTMVVSLEKGVCF